MRNVFLFLLMTLGTACSRKAGTMPEQQAHNLIKKYMDSNLVNPESYVPRGFRKMDTVMTTFYDSPAYDLLPIEGRIQALSDSAADYGEYKKKAASGYYRQMDWERYAAMASLAKAHKPKVRNYRVVHTFRATPYFRSLEHMTIFTIDPGLTRVIDVSNGSIAFRRKPDNLQRKLELFRRKQEIIRRKKQKESSPFQLIAHSISISFHQFIS